MADFPFVLANGRIKDLLEGITAAARPEKFSLEFLERMGFTSSNDRAFVPLFRKLGFITESGAPTSLYDELRDPTRRAYVLGHQIKSLYAPLYAIHTSAHTLGDAELRAAVARVTGKEETTATRIANTFKALVAQANFAADPAPSAAAKAPEVVTTIAPTPEASASQVGGRKADFHYNIQIVLPATTEVSVYNAIFKSLRENLGI